MDSTRLFGEREKKRRHIYLRAARDTSF